MNEKLYLVVQSSDADAGDMGVLGLYDNLEAAYECANDNDYTTVIALHFYPVRSKYEPEEDEDACD